MPVLLSWLPRGRLKVCARSRGGVDARSALKRPLLRRLLIRARRLRRRQRPPGLDACCLELLAQRSAAAPLPASRRARVPPGAPAAQPSPPAPPAGWPPESGRRRIKSQPLPEMNEHHFPKQRVAALNGHKRRQGQRKQAIRQLQARAGALQRDPETTTAGADDATRPITTPLSTPAAPPRARSASRWHLHASPRPPPLPARTGRTLRRPVSHDCHSTASPLVWPTPPSAYSTQRDSRVNSFVCASRGGVGKGCVASEERA